MNIIIITIFYFYFSTAIQAQNSEKELFRKIWLVAEYGYSTTDSSAVLKDSVLVFFNNQFFKKKAYISYQSKDGRFTNCTYPEFVHSTIKKQRLASSVRPLKILGCCLHCEIFPNSPEIIGIVVYNLRDSEIKKINNTDLLLVSDEYWVRLTPYKKK